MPLFSPFLPSCLLLGEGSFGSVYLVRRISDSQLYALKKVSAFFHFITLAAREYQSKQPSQENKKSDVSHFACVLIGANHGTQRERQVECTE